MDVALSTSQHYFEIKSDNQTRGTALLTDISYARTNRRAVICVCVDMSLYVTSPF